MKWFFFKKKITEKMASKTVTVHDVTIYHDILYKNHIRYPKWLDVYQPAPNVERKGIILYIHGGAFVMGSRRVAATPAFQLAKEGYAVVAPDYSLTDVSEYHLTSLMLIILMAMLLIGMLAQTVFQVLFILFLLSCMTLFFTFVWLYCPMVQVQHPDHIQDIAQVYKWMVDNGSESNFQWWNDQKQNPNIIVMGHSAGAHLASLLCTNLQYLNEAGISSHEQMPLACVSISGLYSDKRLAQTTIGRQILHNTFGKRPSYFDAFPIYHVTPQTCPFLLLNAGYDISLKQHAMDFWYTLKANAVYSQIEYFDHTNHFDIAKKWHANGGTNRQVLETITEFLTRVVSSSSSLSSS